MNILTNRYTLIISSSVVCTWGVVLLKDYLSGPKYEGTNRLQGTTVVITGANSGLGRELTRELFQRGAKVLMACKDVKLAKGVRDEIMQKADGQSGEIAVRKLDLNSLDSVYNFVENIDKRNENVDYLINNAGVMGCKRKVSVDGIEQHLAVNYLGHFLLTNLITQRGDCKKVVNVLCRQKNKVIDFKDLNSEHTPYDDGRAYSQSKYALFLFTKELARRMHDTCTVVCGVFPGLVNTSLARNKIESSIYIFRVMFKPFLWIFMKSPYQGIQPILRAMLEDVPSGSIYYLDEPYEIVEPTENADAHRLWLTSQVWSRLDKYIAKLNGGI